MKASTTRQSTRPPAPDTPAFRRWFGNSCVVTTKGKPLVVYHGTTAMFDTFDLNRRGTQTGEPNTQLGFFFTSSFADVRDWYYPKKVGGYIKVYLSIQNPLRLEHENNDLDTVLYDTATAHLGYRPRTRKDWQAYRDYLRDRGFDGIEFHGFRAREFVVFEPTQIKSATANVGTFDPHDPNMLRNPLRWAQGDPMKTVHYSRRRNPEEEVTDEEAVATPLAFGDVAFLEDDGLTDEQRKRALTWLKKRAERTEGVFDAEDAHLGVSLLPGWSSEIQTTLRAVSLNSTTSDSSFPAALVEAGLTHDPKPGNRSPNLGASSFRGASNIVGARAAGDYDDPRIIADASIAETFRKYDPKKVKVKSLPAGRWATDILWKNDGTAVIEKPTLVFAEQGGLRVTNPEGVTETLKGGKAAWTAFYGTRDRSWNYSGGLGIVAAAQSVLPALERKVETRAAFAKSNERAWGGALCPVCFQRAAVTPTSQHMVDHRHTRPGYGYNVAPCEGNRFAPYMLSPEGSAWMLERLEAILPVRLEKLRNVIATPTKQVYTVKEVVTDARGMPVYDLVPPHKANYRGEKKARTEVVPVKYGHELYDEKYAKHVKTLKAELAATINAIPFYAAAVRVWKKGLDEMEPILRGIRETDKPALPLELRNNPRRRTAVAHLPARRKVTR